MVLKLTMILPTMVMKASTPAIIAIKAVRTWSYCFSVLVLLTTSILLELEFGKVALPVTMVTLMKSIDRNITYRIKKYDEAEAVLTVLLKELTKCTLA